ncbi:hypothetical protein ACIPV2_01910 [Microbacterium sp. NPDC089987]|uniref:hypothetical protein n=1 Tax=Microbacterium sp. NPDC089987 TaxID=3364202 RepID=UPI0037F3FB39
MNENAQVIAGLHAGLPQALVAVVTICAAAVIGLVVLHRPDRAAITWAAAFGLGLVGTYAWVTAVELELPAMRALASGLMLCAEPLIWLGVRLYAGRRSSWQAAVMFVALVPITLALTAESEVFAVFFRICFAGAGVFAGLIAFELLRLKNVPRDILLPLMLASGGFAITAALNVLWTLSTPQLSGEDQIAVLRDFNVIGTLITSVAATLTILLLARVQPPNSASTSANPDAVIRGRVERVRAHQEAAWSLLDVRLDGLVDLRESTASSDFALIVKRFTGRVVAALPPSADVAPIDDGRLLALVPGSEEAVTHHLRNLLGRVSSTDERLDPSAIRTSASVGWATVLEARFDYDTLVELADERAQRAVGLGGDRWERNGRVTADADDATNLRG